MSGAKIIEGLKDAVAGNFSSVYIEGQHWVRADWQPIETAPKDGTDIIVYRPNFDGLYIPQVGTDYWMTKGMLVPTWAKSRKDCQPTHWMPFPPPPVQER